ncbi:hypothetical protein [Facklamia sp. P12950]|uniref:hypothetical protein n=1 Tax=Facklamia sp. P12950 TaxID=3421951 RepID=UPI003D17ED35
MKEIFVLILMRIWAFAWYKLGYIQAQIDEMHKRIRDLYRDIERNIDEIKDNIDNCNQVLNEVRDRNEENKY